MADVTILSGDIGVNYFANNRQKLLYWIGGTNTSYTMNEVYSAMATLLDETGTIDDGTAFSAETPVEYTIGKIDSGDTEPWYITYDLMEHITGGALRTSGWTRVTDTNTGIICVPVDPGGAIVAADAGNDITGATTGAGTLLEFIDTGGTWDYCIIRPDGSASSNDFVTVDQNLTCNGHVAVQWDTAGSTTGEQIWANLYSLGTIDPNVHMYVYQGAVATDGDRVRVYSWNDATQDWYGNGHIDICVAQNDMTQTTWTVIDDGYMSVFARKGGDYYANFEVATSTTAGGRNPIPINSATDPDQGTGTSIIATTGGWTGVYVNGEIITGNSTGARGIVDIDNSDTSGEQYISYFPIDDPQVDFTTSDTVVTGATSGATSAVTTNATAAGPALNTWFTSNTTPTATFGTATYDVDDDGNVEDYAITIDCKNNPLSEVYEWLKYATRNGETTNDLDGINGESYIGGEVYLYYGDTETITGTVSEGSDVTQETSGATGVIISKREASKILMLRDTRGTFATGTSTDHTITDNDQSGTFEMETADNAVAVTFAPKSASPLGTYAGGTFFGARGVLISNWLAADENSFQLTPIEGGTKERPASITLSVTNLVGGAETSNLHDKVAIFRVSGGIIEKTEYNCTGGEAAGAATITVDEAITQDTPGKATGGKLVIVDDPTGTGSEYTVRYASWDTSTFTLNEITGTADTGTGATTLVDDEATFTDGADQVWRGDLVFVSGKGWAYVKTVDSDTQLTLAGDGISGFVSTDTFEINVCPVAIVSADQMYVPFMDQTATTDTESVSIIYVGSTDYMVKVRNTRATTKIKPFSTTGNTTGDNVSVPVVRTEDTIIT
jgi:hypothetical protein